jgi:hypothetical protein
MWPTTYVAIQQLQAQLLQQGLRKQAVKLPAWHHPYLLQRRRISNSSRSMVTTVSLEFLQHILQDSMAAAAAATAATAAARQAEGVLMLLP